MQRESIKSLLALGLIISVVATLVAGLLWDGKPAHLGPTLIWAAIAAASLAGLCFMHFRKDRAHDFLSEHCDEFFEKGGFCFLPFFQKSGDQGMMVVMFQNRYEGAVRAAVALRPQDRINIEASEFDGLRCDIECSGGAFGIVEVPLFMPPEYQGYSICFEVGADVKRTERKGKLLRMRDGIAVNLNTQFRNYSGTALMILGFFAGWLIFSSAATTTLNTPKNIKTKPDKRPADPQVHVLWKPGDDPTDAENFSLSERSIT